jgi:hypothetical protein
VTKNSEKAAQKATHPNLETPSREVAERFDDFLHTPINLPASPSSELALSATVLMQNWLKFGATLPYSGFYFRYEKIRCLGMLMGEVKME